MAAACVLLVKCRIGLLSGISFLRNELPCRRLARNLACQISRRGKSGLHKATVPGNPRRGQPQGKRHREETAP